MMTRETRIRKNTKILIDSADFFSFDGFILKKFAIQDATTNPSLIYQIIQKKEIAPLLEEAIFFGKRKGKNQAQQKEIAFDKVLVNIGLEILKKLSGHISIQMDPRDAYDRKKIIERAKRVIFLLEENGIDRERIWIKIASTWEGMEACHLLQKESISCNMTLIFSFVQALVSAQMGAKCVAPYVGRVKEWYEKNEQKKFSIEIHPGLLLVKEIYSFFKENNLKTFTMGASFRSIEEIYALQGVDLLTISPRFFPVIENESLNIENDFPKNFSTYKGYLEKKEFITSFDQNRMAKELLKDGLHRFCKDAFSIDQMLESMESCLFS